MRFYSFIATIFFFSIGYSQAPKFLILEHRSKPKEVVIKEGEVVAIRTFKGEKVKGQLVVLSDRLIKVKHKVVPLTSVRSLGRRSAPVARVASMLVTTGMNLMLYGVSNNLKNGWNDELDNYKASGPLLALGIPLLTVTYKRTSEHWKFKGQMPGW